MIIIIYRTFTCIAPMLEFRAQNRKNKTKMTKTTN